MTKEEFYSRALSFDEVGEQVDIFKKEKIKYEQEIERLNNIINELERRFNQELENNEKYDIEDTKEFYSKKWVRDTLNDFINMIKELK